MSERSAGGVEDSVGTGVDVKLEFRGVVGVEL